MIGDSVPAGKRERTVATFSRTSLAASWTLRSSTNVAKTWDWPSIVDERSSSSPLMVLTTSSIGLVIWLSISSGEAPSSRVVMVMVGRSTLGKMSTPSWTNEASPSTTRVAITMVVKTGRRTKTSRNPTGLPLGVDEGDGRAVEELGQVRRRHRLPGLHAVEDLDAGALARARLDHALLDLAVG